MTDPQQDRERLAADPHHNGDCTWMWDGEHLHHRDRGQSKWTRVRRISFTPERIKVIAQLLSREPESYERPCPLCGEPYAYGPLCVNPDCEGHPSREPEPMILRERWANQLHQYEHRDGHGERCIVCEQWGAGRHMIGHDSDCPVPALLSREPSREPLGHGGEQVTTWIRCLNCWPQGADEPDPWPDCEVCHGHIQLPLEECGTPPAPEPDEGEREAFPPVETPLGDWLDEVVGDRYAVEAAWNDTRDSSDIGFGGLNPTYRDRLARFAMTLLRRTLATRPPSEALREAMRDEGPLGRALCLLRAAVKEAPGQRVEMQGDEVEAMWGWLARTDATEPAGGEDDS